MSRDAGIAQALERVTPLFGAILAAAMGCGGAMSAAPTTEPTENVLIDAGARVWASQPTGDASYIESVVAVATVSAPHPTDEDRRVQLRIELLTERDSSTVCAVSNGCTDCRLESPDSLPERIDCTMLPGTEHERVRHVDLRTREGEIHLTLDGNTGMIAPVPMSYHLTRQSPLIAAREGFRPKKGRPSQLPASGSPESKRLNLLVQSFAQALRNLDDVHEVIAELGVDPLTLPRLVASQINEIVDSINLDTARVPQLRRQFLTERLERPLVDAGLIEPLPQSPLR